VCGFFLKKYVFCAVVFGTVGVVFFIYKKKNSSKGAHDRPPLHPPRRKNSFSLSLSLCPGGTYIEMVQTVLESPEPSLPPNTERRQFSNELRQFASSCVHKNPKERLPADILLGSPWFQKHSATSLDVSVNALRSWIRR
jgi:hypothetical protein